MDQEKKARKEGENIGKRKGKAEVLEGRKDERIKETESMGDNAKRKRERRKKEKEVKRE
ncbi:hypothetical protein KIN20_005909 [Parelaphostrongylus tenuis]|uniref:Uncharacterized protein n=1 Tax=Parelaphostrongylus tenuis TaxID=148309 RepID=A0AAD5M2V1_PARTN|nr:hypothetical protein KIN20_005909 [Parelaphostrongylus tenuis]